MGSARPADGNDPRTSVGLAPVVDARPVACMCSQHCGLSLHRHRTTPSAHHSAPRRPRTARCTPLHRHNEGSARSHSRRHRFRSVDPGSHFRQRLRRSRCASRRGLPSQEHRRLGDCRQRPGFGRRDGRAPRAIRRIEVVGRAVLVARTPRPTFFTSPSEP